MDDELMTAAIAQLDEERARQLRAEAEEELAAFGNRLPADARTKAIESAFARLVARERRSSHHPVRVDMPVQQGEQHRVAIEKPAAGGRMIARHEGQVVLVQGGIPGERVRARIERVERQLAFADAVDVLEPSADRRSPAMDPACGGCLYAHIGYDRQRALKAEIIRDAFARLGRIPIESAGGRRLSRTRLSDARAAPRARRPRRLLSRGHARPVRRRRDRADGRAGDRGRGHGRGRADRRRLRRVSGRADREHRRRRARAARAAGGRRRPVRSRAGQRVDGGRVDRLHRAIRER